MRMSAHTSLFILYAAITALTPPMLMMLPRYDGDITR